MAAVLPTVPQLQPIQLASFMKCIFSQSLFNKVGHSRKSKQTQVAPKVSSWHNSAKIFRLVSQCMGLMISQLRILRASSILWAFVVPSWCSYRLKKAGVPSLIQLTLIFSQGHKLNWLGWLCGSAASRCPAGRGSCSTCELGRSASTGRRSRKAFRSDSAKSLDPF